MKKIAIYGGTFNPIHNGHIIAVHTLVDCGMFDEVQVMPSAVPPFKEEEAKLGVHRLNMVKMAFESVNDVVVNDFEYNSKELSYTYNTLCSMQQINPDNQYYWVIGFDNLAIIEKWKNSQQLLTEFGLVVMNRGGYEPDKANAILEHLRASYETDIITVQMPNVELSSTDIRHRITENKSLIGYIPESLSEYIYKEKLYTE